jgi:hypothetical protein
MFIWEKLKAERDELCIKMSKKKKKIVRKQKFFDWIWISITSGKEVSIDLSRKWTLLILIFLSFKIHIFKFLTFF